MKKHYLLMALCAGALLTSCNKENEKANLPHEKAEENVYTITRTFAEPVEGAIDLSAMTSTNKRLRDLFDKAGPGIIQSMGSLMNITDEQYEEIAEYTTKLTKNDATQTAKYKTIYNHMNVEEIYFPEGTKRIESFAIENCPKLKRLYIPVDAEIAKDALYKISQWT